MQGRRRVRSVLMLLAHVFGLSAYCGGVERRSRGQHGPFMKEISPTLIIKYCTCYYVEGSRGIEKVQSHLLPISHYEVNWISLHLIANNLLNNQMRTK